MYLARTGTFNPLKSSIARPTAYLLSLTLLLLIQGHAERRNHGQINHWRHGHEILHQTQ